MSWPSLTLLYLCFATNVSPRLCAQGHPVTSRGQQRIIQDSQEMLKFLQACVLKDNAGNVHDVKCQDMLSKGTVEDISRRLFSEPITAQRTRIGQDIPFQKIALYCRKNK
ncbi:hypothetical protein CDAR_530371 [Caerostris darwini]|uniref:Uncharacterized protein n=1 Tax=Caerostris darwini TaxID=1538125 RepID=A0AAV4NKA2_9ARAC|nr:hypothetical protein CDAR_530371 [Caerostris darwini]